MKWKKKKSNAQLVLKWFKSNRRLDQHIDPNNKRNGTNFLN